MGETLPLFTATFNRGLSVEARPERLTGDAGAVLLREILECSGIVPWLVGRLADPRRANLVTYRLDALLRTVLVLFGQGWRDQDDADALRLDPASRLATAREHGAVPLEDGRHPPSQPTLSRLLDILSTDANRRVLREAITEVAGRRLRAERRGHRQRRLCGRDRRKARCTAAGRQRPHLRRRPRLHPRPGGPRGGAVPADHQP